MELLNKVRVEEDTWLVDFPGINRNVADDLLSDFGKTVYHVLMGAGLTWLLVARSWN
jgi:hypothetical protein